MKVTAKEINVLLSKIAEIDPERAAYIKRRVNLNLANNCFEYDGKKSIINGAFEKIIEFVNKEGLYENE